METQLPFILISIIVIIIVAVLFFTVSKNGSECREVAECLRGTNCQQVHQVIGFTGGKLDQAYLLAVSEQAIGFGIHCKVCLVCQDVRQPFQPTWFGDGLAEFRNGHALIIAQYQ